MPDDPRESDPTLADVLEIHRELLAATRDWAAGAAPGPEVAAARHRALRLNHRRYAEKIPAYRQLCESAGATGEVDVGFIANELLLYDVFKSYDDAWLEARDFRALTGWLGTVCVRAPAPDLDGVNDLAEWRTRLRRDGITLSWSSGTSGRLSFVPRDGLTFRALCTNGATYTDESWRRGAGGALRPFDCLVLGPRGGGVGLLDAGAGLARVAEHSHFLFDRELTPDEVRASAGRESGADPYPPAFDFVRDAGAAQRLLLIFGPPFQVRRFCEAIASGPGRLPAPEGSLLVTGGGWKSFAGERLGRETLWGQVESRLGIAASRCIDAFSTSELNCTLRTCSQGRYHVPPLLEAVVLDEGLATEPGRSGEGLLGFLDPFALSYPGFVITGDRGHLEHGACACGLHGAFVDGEIERARGAELRGCGGVVGALTA